MLFVDNKPQQQVSLNHCRMSLNYSRWSSYSERGYKNHDWGLIPLIMRIRCKSKCMSIVAIHIASWERKKTEKKAFSSCGFSLKKMWYLNSFMKSQVGHLNFLYLAFMHQEHFLIMYSLFFFISFLSSDPSRDLTFKLLICNHENCKILYIYIKKGIIVKFLDSNHGSYQENIKHYEIWNKALSIISKVMLWKASTVWVYAHQQVKWSGYWNWWESSAVEFI